MKIAVTYDDGQVFQHFGHTKQFKVYEADGGKILSSNIIDASGSGHGALAGFLKKEGIDVLICGGIGAGAIQALEESGIQMIGGAKGDADAQAEAFLAGDLTNDPSAKCSHHNHECGNHCH